MSITQEYINNRCSSGHFVNNPDNKTPIEIVLYQHYLQNAEGPLFSIVMPVYNQENIIANNLQSVLDNTTEKIYELILIIDACSDQTEKEIIQWVKNIQIASYPLLDSILVLKSNIPLFETAADNLGFYCSRGKYCLEIQADMQMCEPGYNMKLLRPFIIDDTIIGISGRCCHNYTVSIGVGKLGADVTIPLSNLPYIDTTCYYIGDTCNRGPLLIDKEKLQQMGYLDEVNYFLDNSDHDLFARAYHYKKWICGYTPIDYISPLQNGSTRKPRDTINTTYYNLKKMETTRNNTGFYENNQNTLVSRPITKHKF